MESTSMMSDSSTNRLALSTTTSTTTTTLTPLERLNEASRKAVEVVNRFANTDPPSASECQSPLDDDDDTAAAAGANNNNTNNNSKNNNNPWKNPQLIQDELVVARNELAEAWKTLKAERDNEKSTRAAAIGGGGGGGYRDDDDDDDDNGIDSNNNNNDNDNQEDISEEEFRVLYMDMITDAFGDVLGQMNKEVEDQDQDSNASKATTTTTTTPVDVDVLVDCLQSGIDFLDPDQRNRKSFFDSLDYNNTDGNGDDDDDDDDDDNDDDDDDDGKEEDLTTTVHEMRQRSLGYLVSTGGDE